MNRLGFDNDKYLQMQSALIRERIDKFGGKLYLEFGGKLFDDYHASRVLPGFHPDSKITMLLQLKDQAEIVIVINSADIEKNYLRPRCSAFDRCVPRQRSLRGKRGSDPLSGTARSGCVPGSPGGARQPRIPPLPDPRLSFGYCYNRER